MSEIVPVTAISNLRPLRPLLFRHQGIPYTVVLKNNRVNAFVNICPHQDKIFKPRMKADCVICPFHDVVFDAESGDVINSNGKTVRGPLPKAQVLLREGWIYLVIDEQHRALMTRAVMATKARALKRKWRWTRLLGLDR